MLTEQQINNLLFINRNYFDCEENCSQYTLEELKNILTHLENLAEKYFIRIMELHNDPHERSDKTTARNVMNNAYNKVYNYYLTKCSQGTTKLHKQSYYIYYVIVVGIILSILLYFII